MRRLWASLTLALLLSGCQTTAQRSAELERRAKRNALHTQAALTITKANPDVKVLDSQVLHESEASAVVVTVRNTSSVGMRDVPIQIAVHDSHDEVLFRNDAPGVESALSSIPLLEPGAQTVWIDDQVQTSRPPANVTAVVGPARHAPVIVPRIAVSAVSIQTGTPSSAIGTVHNDSDVAQQNLVVYGLARSGSRVLAAGRAVISELGAHQSSHFEMFLVGTIGHAKLELSAPPSTF